MPLLKQRDFESRLTSIKYQVLKNFPDLTDAQKVAAAQSIYDAAIDADTSINVNTLPTFAFGNVDLMWSNDGKSVEIHAGSVSISDDLSDEEKVVVPGLDSHGISIIYPGNTLPTGSASKNGVEPFTYVNVSDNPYLPLNNDIDKTLLTCKILTTSDLNNQWEDYGDISEFITEVEGQPNGRAIRIRPMSPFTDNYFKIEGPGYETLYVRYLVQNM